MMSEKLIEWLRSPQIKSEVLKSSFIMQKSLVKSLNLILEGLIVCITNGHLYSLFSINCLVIKNKKKASRQNQ